MSNSAVVVTRPYERRDRAACLGIFDGNVPEHFARTELADFVTFVDSGAADYLVLENDAGIVIGCGGYYIERAAGVAGLAWGMVDRAWHKRGIGRFLLEARLTRLRCSPDVSFVRVNTSQKSRGFFSRCGFRVVREVVNGFVPGIDRIEMELALR